MRRQLKEIVGQRKRFSGKFVRFGSKTTYKGYQKTTVLLGDIRDGDGKKVCDHLWFNYTKGFKSIGKLEEGDIIEFDARAKPYVKGYVNKREWIDNREVDYKLSYPTKFTKE